MAGQPPEKTRRIPTQGRSRSTVDAICEATFQLLEEGGRVESLNTNEIARRAGVSIGTLYQYFGGKQDILAAMAQRRAEATRERITHTLLAAPDVTSLRTIVRSLMSAFEGSLPTRLALLDAFFRANGDEELRRHHQLFLEAIQGKAELGIALSPESAFVLTHTVVSLLRAAAAEPDLGLSPEALEDELVLLMESYVAAQAIRQATSR